MGACNFSIPFSGDAENVLTKAKAAIESQQGIFTGDANAGSFSVSVFGNSIKGSYSVNGQYLNITITDKPLIVPCGTIESLLKSKIS